MNIRLRVLPPHELAEPIGAALVVYANSNALTGTAPIPVALEFQNPPDTKWHPIEVVLE